VLYNLFYSLMSGEIVHLLIDIRLSSLLNMHYLYSVFWVLIFVVLLVIPLSFNVVHYLQVIHYLPVS